MPTGDSLESRFSDGLASVEPTIVYFSDLPEPSSLTDTSEPTRTTFESSSDGVDHRRGAELLLEGGDPRLEHRLLVLGVVVLGVLGDVAELARFLDALGDLAALDGGEVLDLILQLVEPFGGEQDVSLHLVVLGRVRRKEKPAQIADLWCAQAVGAARHGSTG